jgi:DNA-binding response OmpR family regulator
MSAPLESRPGIWVDADQFVVRYGDKSIELTKSEFPMCRLLASRPGHIKSTAAILNVLTPVYEKANETSVTGHVKRLRQKFRASLGVDPIKTHHGEGYSWNGAA